LARERFHSRSNLTLLILNKMRVLILDRLSVSILNRLNIWILNGPNVYIPNGLNVLNLICWKCVCSKWVQQFCNDLILNDLAQNWLNILTINRDNILASDWFDILAANISGIALPHLLNILVYTSAGGSPRSSDTLELSYVDLALNILIWC
jgi:hypothetical protein